MIRLFIPAAGEMPNFRLRLCMDRLLGQKNGGKAGDEQLPLPVVIGWTDAISPFEFP